jgi:hypothetical protein
VGVTPFSFAGRDSTALNPTSVVRLSAHFGVPIAWRLRDGCVLRRTTLPISCFKKRHGKETRKIRFARSKD